MYPERDPNWGYDSYKSGKELLPKSPARFSVICGSYNKF